MSVKAAWMVVFKVFDEFFTAAEQLYLSKPTKVAEWLDRALTL